MFSLVSYPKFRDTPSVRFFDVTIPDSNVCDLVVHNGPAVSPPDTTEGYWQFYLHPHQEDNLLAVTGGRTFYLVNFSWSYPFHIVRLEATPVKVTVCTKELMVFCRFSLFSQQE